MTSSVLTAIADDAATILFRAASREAGRMTIGRFLVDVGANELTYQLSSELTPGTEHVVKMHGFAPPGWDAAPLMELRGHAGVWRYDEAQEKNLLEGLTYLSVESAATGGILCRAQIEAENGPPPQFPTAPELSRLVGTCDRSLSFFGVFERTPVDMEPAIVAIVRSPEGISRAGQKLVRLTFEAHCDGGAIPGVGRALIDVLPEAGWVESLQQDSDFPARMEMSLRMRYITPAGRFVSETETYVAARIDRFPPFGVELVPTRERVPVFDERTGAHVGDEYLGSLVPLFHLEKNALPGRIPTRKGRR